MLTGGRGSRIFTYAWAARQRFTRIFPPNLSVSFYHIRWKHGKILAAPPMNGPIPKGSADDGRTPPQSPPLKRHRWRWDRPRVPPGSSSDSFPWTNRQGTVDAVPLGPAPPAKGTVDDVYSTPGPAPQPKSPRQGTVDVVYTLFPGVLFEYHKNASWCVAQEKAKSDCYAFCPVSTIEISDIWRWCHVCDEHECTTCSSM